MRVPIVAGLVIAFAAVIEWTKYPGATATAHLFYGWAIIYAISFGLKNGRPDS